jgi:hypothetical protein
VQGWGRFIHSAALHETFWKSVYSALVNQVEVFDYCYFMIIVFGTTKAIFNSARRVKAE